MLVYIQLDIYNQLQDLAFYIQQRIETVLLKMEKVLKLNGTIPER